jgi:hypothetical protein
VRTIARQLNGFLVIGGPQREVTAHHFLGFAVRTIEDAQFSLLCGNDLAALIHEFIADDIAAAGANLVCPGLVLFHNPLHLFRRHAFVSAWLFMHDQHELGHEWSFL